ncbi:hypothetical protein JCM18750_37320 [Halostagnicola bangensis]
MDFEIDASKMFTATCWLAIFEVRTDACLRFDIDVVGIRALTENDCCLGVDFGFVGGRFSTRFGSNPVSLPWPVFDGTKTTSLR